jgi:putative membrane protein
MERDWRVEAGLLALVAVALGVSGWAPFDRATWLLEVFPVFAAVALLLATRRRFPLTRLVYCLIAAHALILILGGAYTYARVPVGFWLQDVFHFQRNPYDRIGHLAQGFVPALAAREILLRMNVVRGRGWLFFLVASVCLAISACYEFIEWGAAVAFGQGAEEFLATQGDPWDTQSDMAMALIGAVAAQVLLGPWHDRALAKVAGTRRMG